MRIPGLEGTVAKVLAPLVEAAVDARVQAALAAHREAEPHVPPNDLLEQYLVYGDRAKLHIASTAVINNALFNLSSGEITVEEYAFFGHNVSVLTGTHDVTKFDRERQVTVPKSGRDVVIGRGVWVSSNATVLGPARIGEHAVVAANSLVTGDVPPYTIVAGTPAKKVRMVPRPGEEVRSDVAPGVAPAKPVATTSTSASPSPSPSPSTEAGGGPRFSAMYRPFQDRFRGGEDDIRDRLAIYLADVDKASTGLRVLDVGPGRGEWLSLLAERGVPAYGVEANGELVEHIRETRGLEVVHADAVAHLRGLEAGSLDAVTAFHVIEHLEIDPLLALLSAAHHALRPGGQLLLETPDPTNLVMAACNFRLDPTHREPLPPKLTEFLVAQSGFVDVEIRKLHPREDVDLQGLRLEGVAPDVASMLGEALTTALFGPQDYAVVATAHPDRSPGS